VDVIQIRERDLESRALADVTARVLAATRGSRTRVVVNDRADVAIAAGAHGVHLRGDSAAPHRVRAIVPPSFLIGRSVHSVAEAAAVAGEVDYLIAGAVWATTSKPAGHPQIGCEGLAAIARAVRVPVLAIGGVTLERARDAALAGAAGVAAIRLFAGDRGEPVRLDDTVRAIRAAFGIT
jgi:thiamine-phosphate diphosphorylase